MIYRLCVTLVLLATPVLAHDAPATVAYPNGWSYPTNCCSDRDCKPIPADAIRERPQGYVIRNTGEVVGYGDGRIKISPDGEYHWCSQTVFSKNDKDMMTPFPHTVCLFVPPKGF